MINLGDIVKIKKQKKLDLQVIIPIILFGIISIITIYSAQDIIPSYYGNVAIKQACWFLVGFAFIVLILKIGNDFIFHNIIGFYIIIVFLLAFLLVAPESIAKSINGAKCWYTFGNLFSFQPTEFMKVILIILISKITFDFQKQYSNPTLKQEAFFLIKTFGVVIIPAIFTFLEPDTGAVVIYFVILFSILLVSGIRIRWFFYIAIIILLLGGAVLLLHQNNSDLFIDIFGTNFFYRLDRIFSWQEGSGMQLENALATIGSSGVFGHGYLNNPLYFPEAHTDFIFAVYAGNFGLMGTLFFLTLIAFFALKLINITHSSISHLSKLIVFGIIGLFLFGSFWSIGMTLGLTPIMGIAMPFISYGGSSILANMILVGIVLNIINQKYYVI